MGNNDYVLKVEGLSKKFCRHLRRSMIYGMQDLCKNMFGVSSDYNHIRKDEFWALQDINFELRKGDSLGVIGLNGSGKTTLLRIINGIFPPDKGRLEIKGRLGSLIAVGAGFHPHMTGKENVFLNGTILGMSKKEISEKFDEIVDFSDIGDFLEAPVSTYSSGMRVRLGFAIAVNISPDILVVDEVLSVGDQSFRRKARNRMGELLNSGSTVIFVSHNIHEVIGITEKVIWLEKGKIHQEGKSDIVCRDYIYASTSIDDSIVQKFDYSPKRTGEVFVENVTCQLSGQNCGQTVTIDGPERSIYITMTIKTDVPINEKLNYYLGIKTIDNLDIGYIIFDDFKNMDSGENYTVFFKLDLQDLHIGKYLITFQIGTEGGPMLEGINNLIFIYIKSASTNLRMPSNSVNYSRMYDNTRGSHILSAEMSI